MTEEYGAELGYGGTVAIEAVNEDEAIEKAKAFVRVWKAKK